MTQIKKFAWGGSVAAVALLMAMAMLVQTVQAAALTGVAGPATAPLVGSSNPAGQVAAATTATIIPAGTAKIAVQFPTGTTFGTAASTAGNWTFNNDGDTSTMTATAVSLSGTTATITVTIAAGGTAGYAAGTAMVVTGAAGVVIYPASPTSSGSLTVTTQTSTGTTIDTGSISNFTVVGLTVSPSPTSVPADGISTVSIGLQSAAATTTGGDTLTVTTSAGGFVGATATVALGADATWNSVGSAATPSTSASDVMIAAPTGAAGTSVTLRSPNTAGSAQIQVYVVPAAGGAAKLVAQSTVTFTTATAAPVLSSIVVTPTTTQSVAAAGGAGNAAQFSITLQDQFGNTLGSGTTVTVSTSGNAVVNSNATTCTLGTANTGAAVNSDADCSFTSTGGADSVEVYGINVPGTTTVTIKATPAGSTTPIQVTRTVTLTGSTVSSIDLKLYQVSPTATKATEGSIILDRDDSTGSTDELIAVALLLDANGNPITPSGLATFSVTDSTNNPVAILGTGEQVAPQAGAACDGTINTTLGTCTDTPQANVALNKAGAAAVIDNDKSSTSPLAAGTYTVTVTWGTGSAQKTASATFTVAGPAATVTLTGDTNIAINGSGSVEAMAVDANGNPVADGTTVNFASSSAIVLLQTSTGTQGTVNLAVTTTAGKASVSMLGLAKGESQIVASAGSKNGLLIVTVGNAVVTPPTGDGTLTTPSFGTGNVGSAVFAGGTIEQLATQVTAAGGTSVWVQGTDGNWYRYNTLASGATAFVNNAFIAQFEAGIGNVAVFVVK